MRVVIMCATDRGYRFADKLFQLGRGLDFTVFSFRETAWEPPFLAKIKSLTVTRGHQFYEARNVAHPKFASFWRHTPVDLILMVSWRYVVPESIYSRARKGSYVFHDSLLPKYRGFAPTVWSIINGERETGVSLFKASDSVDAGDIVDQRRTTIAKSDAIASVMAKITEMYLEVAERNFADMLDGSAASYPQNHADATYTCKWIPSDARIDWSKGAHEIYNLIRATSWPYPGAYTCIGGRKLIVWSAELPTGGGKYVSRAPGRVIEFHPEGCATVLTGDGAIRLRSVQFDGEPAVNAGRVLRSLSQTLGEWLR